MTEAEAIAALERWYENYSQRNTLVREAHKAGVSKHRIYVITGIARTTIDRILDTPEAVKEEKP
jgi:hypothetical protein